jgi:two-component system cell cycle response regulator DivK
VSQGRILVVDDNLMNVELVCFMLEAADFTVATSRDAQAALGTIPAFGPDLILMDIQMPGMDGLELTRLLKSEPKTAHIPIMAFTAYAMKGDETRMRAAGCDGYVSKPIDVRTFMQKVRALLAPGNRA